jgi:hypothetical protein
MRAKILVIWRTLSKSVQYEVGIESLTAASRSSEGPFRSGALAVRKPRWTQTAGLKPQPLDRPFARQRGRITQPGRLSRLVFGVEWWETCGRSDESPKRKYDQRVAREGLVRQQFGGMCSRFDGYKLGESKSMVRRLCGVLISRHHSVLYWE